MEKKYYGAVVQSNKVFNAVVSAYQHCKKQSHYEVDNCSVDLGSIQSGKLKAVTMVDGVVTAFKVAKNNIIAEMAITNGNLVAVHMERVPV